VLDRLIQQVIQQILYEHFDNGFSRHSYGIRKGKNAHQAILQALDYVNNGSKYVVDVDLSNFFDRLLGSRLRYCIWKSWKRIRTRIRNLIKLGLPEWLAIKIKYTAMFSEPPYTGRYVRWCERVEIRN
jgi:retron-type reverse transcriptase